MAAEVKQPTNRTGVNQAFSNKSVPAMPNVTNTSKQDLMHPLHASVAANITIRMAEVRLK
jgi:hypothetical protein